MVTIDKSVSENIDDGYVYDPSGRDYSGAYLKIGKSSDKLYSVWLKFNDIIIPRGATIDVSYFKFYDGVSDSATIYTRIYAEDAETPAAPSSRDDYYDKTRTTAYVDWTPGAWGDGWETSPSLNTIIQELVDKHNFASPGKPIQLLWDALTASTGRRLYPQSMYMGMAYAPSLHVEYTPFTGGVGLVDRGLCGTSPLIGRGSSLARRVA